MIKGGYTQKLLRIDLSSRVVQEETLGEEIYKKYLGGRGLAAKYYFDELLAQTEPLSAENKLIFMTGPLTGTPAYSSAKFQLATKSPLTGIYLCSNCGGAFGPNLKYSGYDGLIIEGKSEQPVYLSIYDNKVNFHSAENLMGLDTVEVTDQLKKIHDNEKLSVMSIGPAAEKLVKFACIQVDERSFGRGGSGAVMASKNLKAVVVKGTSMIPLANEKGLKEFIKSGMSKLREGKLGLTQYGTHQLTETINKFGCYPTNNFHYGAFDEPEIIYAENMVKKYKIKNAACHKCFLACSQVCEVKEGPFKGAVSDPEFETVGTLGAQCGVRDMAAVIAANMYCDRLGLDAMQAGTTIAFAMELYERNLIGKVETGGIELTFGNGEAMVEMIKKIGLRQDIGDLLAEGFLTIAHKNPDWVKYMVHVKGMTYAAYEPRGFFGMGLAYGTSSRGACHNVGGWTIRDELVSGKHDRFATAGKGKLVKSLQDTRAYIDSLGICTAARGGMNYSDNPTGTVLEDITGLELTPKLMEIGERVWNLERMILVREGIERKNDYLAERTMTEPLQGPGDAAGKVLSVELYDVMLDEYYRERGWDRNGIPTEERFKGWLCS